MRLPYNVLVIPYMKRDDEFRYCLFKRKDSGHWQFIAGGGEEEDSNILETVKRESNEEAGLSSENKYMKLESFSTIPAKHFGFVWGEDTLVIPEHVYAVSAKEKIKTSSEHQEFIWLSYEEAISILEYDSNKNALWELDYKLKNNIK